MFSAQCRAKPLPRDINLQPENRGSLLSSTSCMGANNSGGSPKRGISRPFVWKRSYSSVLFKSNQHQSSFSPLSPQTRFCERAHTAYEHMHGCITHTISPSPEGRYIVAVTKETHHNTFSSVPLVESSINRRQSVWWCQASGGRGESLTLLPLNFFGGMLRSPASGWTTQRSSTKLWIQTQNNIVSQMPLYFVFQVHYVDVV